MSTQNNITAWVSNRKDYERGKENGEHHRCGCDYSDGGLRRDPGAVREPEGYRSTLEWLTERTDGKGWLSTTEIAALLGINRQTVSKRFGISKGCALPILAMKLAQESR